MDKFESFLKEKTEEAKKSEFNPAERIEKFKQHVAELYDKIDNEWLKQYIESGEIKTGCCPITIAEARLGVYEVNAKWIEIAGNRINLKPIGTEILGTDARVDISYRAKEYMLVRVGENVEGFHIIVSGNGEKPKQKPAGKIVWKLVSKRQRTSYTTLNKDVFTNLLMELMG